MPSLSLFPSNRGAIFSPDRAYRYALWHVWDWTSPVRFYLLCNPSQADEERNDPTVERCDVRARQDGQGGWLVGNLGAYVATDPKAWKARGYPIGRELVPPYVPGCPVWHFAHVRNFNDIAILWMAHIAIASGGEVVCAWGGNAPKWRVAEVLALLKREAIPLHVLRVREGEPWHPLYLPYSEKPKAWAP